MCKGFPPDLTVYCQLPRTIMRARVPRQRKKGGRAALIWCACLTSTPPAALTSAFGRGGPRHLCLSTYSHALYCAANWDSTPRHSGDSDEALLVRHRRMRPPPGSTPAHSVRRSAPQAERITNSTSRGRICRSTITAGAEGAAGAAAGAAGLVAASAAVALPAGAAAPPATAATAFWQAGDTRALFFS